MSAQHTPGPWEVVHNNGEFGWPAGFYVFRSVPTPAGRSNEWMTTNGGIRPFRTESAAYAAIAKATGSAA
ncbi:hypothetical protein ABL840_09015 [Variovorax sp. NFACC27]|uniref:hypothetical protein n=1 Tax=unclassified Variovorax TaxID=663243 RepID=UPI0008976EA2|nr:hypothetical protein SAMN03159371_05292 [Variovorax sp. NFACC28]SEG89581.1 hypothetical protein SAMN03159365_05155 [Variovorax sp. NFACC29]SFD40732.1 hypothetical protein SAMN03159379_05182 [Variovorax sp. NFACC26]SFG42894.1 hypothetical protein SAMN03159447_03292 [Variovorax sp. NFACC27]